jgi:hypothetical protein
MLYKTFSFNRSMIYFDVALKLTVIDLLSIICYATGNQNRDERIFVSWKEHSRSLNPMG